MTVHNHCWHRVAYDEKYGSSTVFCCQCGERGWWRGKGYEIQHGAYARYPVVIFHQQSLDQSARIRVLEAALTAYMEPAGDTPAELRAQAQKALGVEPIAIRRNDDEWYMR